MNGATILGNQHHGKLTSAELERIAYIQGSSLLACYAAEADDLEQQVDGFDDLIEAAKKGSVEDGKRAGLGLVAADLIEDLERSVVDIKASHQRCRTNLQAVYEWLRSDECKTVKSRQAFEKRLHAALNVTPRY
jgi:hypothetical protein